MAYLKHLFPGDTTCVCCGYDFITDRDTGCRLALLTRTLVRIPHRIIAPDCPEGKRARALMTRFFLFRSKYLGIYLHCFHRSDMDDFHDHPWAFVTILLSSGYYEHMPSNVTRFISAEHKVAWRPRFSILYRPAEFQHYVELKKSPTWTLVFRFQRVRDWGYIVNGIWKRWELWDKELKSRSICED